MITIPSSVKLGAPHPEQICVELLRQRGKAKMKVEVFKRFETGKFEMIKDTPFSKVGEK